MYLERRCELMGTRRTVEMGPALPLNRITRPQLEHAIDSVANQPIITGQNLALEISLADIVREISRRNRGRGKDKIR